MAVWAFPFVSANGDRAYGPADWMQFYANIFSTGIVPNTGLPGFTGFQVIQTDTPSLNINVGSGVAIIKGGQIMNTVPKSFQIPAPLTSQSRTDSLVVQWNNSSRSGDIIYKTNSTQVTQTADVYELQIATIIVPANASSISQANIIDTRADTTVCGYSSPYESIKTGDLLAQFKSELEANGVVFSEWFENIKDQLSEDAAGNLQNQLDSLDSKVYTAYANSADGTDGFTTVYPNLNLEQHTEKLVDENDNILWGGKGNATAAMTYEAVTIPNQTKLVNGVHVTQTAAGQAGWRSPLGANGGSIPCLPSSSYTTSAWIKNNTTTPVTISLTLGASASINQTSPKFSLTKIVVPADGLWHYISYTHKTATDSKYIWVYMYTDNGTTSADFTFAGYKLEQGSTATSWMPSASEVSTADWPQYKYVGRMAGLNSSDKSDPANYKWEINTDVVRNQNGDVLVENLAVTGTITQPYISTSFAIGSGVSVTAKRTGNLVTITFKGSNSVKITSGSNFPEKIPLGYRPIEAEGVDPLVVGRHIDSYYYLNPDGSIVYPGEEVPANSYFRGVRSYFTKDPWPIV